MAILSYSCFFTTRTPIIASSHPDNPSPSISSRPSSSNHTILSSSVADNLPKVQLTKYQEQRQVKPPQKRPSILEIEKALGTGIFQETDSDGEPNGKSSLFSIGKREGPLEKKLRETGEWLVDGTERTSRSAGKQVLVATFVWILPMWIIAFFVALGIIPLPFSTTFLDNIIS